MIETHKECAAAICALLDWIDSNRKLGMCMTARTKEIFEYCLGSILDDDAKIIEKKSINLIF